MNFSGWDLSVCITELTEDGMIQRVCLIVFSVRMLRTDGMGPQTLSWFRTPASVPRVLASTPCLLSLSLL